MLKEGILVVYQHRDQIFKRFIFMERTSDTLLFGERVLRVRVTVSVDSLVSNYY